MAMPGERARRAALRRDIGMRPVVQVASNGGQRVDRRHRRSDGDGSPRRGQGVFDKVETHIASRSGSQARVRCCTCTLLMTIGKISNDKAKSIVMETAKDRNKTRAPEHQITSNIRRAMGQVQRPKRARQRCTRLVLTTRWWMLQRTTSDSPLRSLPCTSSGRRQMLCGRSSPRASPAPNSANTHFFQTHHQT
jgi:hypothetical protein